MSIKFSFKSNQIISYLDQNWLICNFLVTTFNFFYAYTNEKLFQFHIKRHSVFPGLDCILFLLFDTDKFYVLGV